MKLKIKVTKEILKRSMWCGYSGFTEGGITKSCAIALAVRDLFPDAVVGAWTIRIDNEVITISEEVQDFINKFDRLKTRPFERLLLDPIEFEVDIPKEIIESIGIDQAEEIINKSETLELVK